MFDPVRPFAQKADPKAVTLQEHAADPSGIFRALRQGPSTFIGGSRPAAFTRPSDTGPVKPQTTK